MCQAFLYFPNQGEYMHYRSLLAGLGLACAVLAPQAARATDVANTAYVEGMQHTPLYIAINQPTIEALYAGANGPGMPGIYHAPPGVGVVPAALGGALGMAIVDASIKAGNHSFAEAHIHALREQCKDANLQENVQKGILDASRDVSWMAGGTTQVVADAKDITPPQDTTGWLEVHTRYALSTDFSHVIVIADVELFRPMPGHEGDWRHKPAFHNTVVYQSQAIHIADKTPADAERMLAEENAHWDQAAINAEIDALNQGSPHDPDMKLRRKALLAKLDQHKRAVTNAKAAHWNRDEQAELYASAWGADNAAALRQSLHEGGQEVGKLVALTFSGRQEDPVAGTASASTDDVPQRAENLRKNGDATSLVGKDVLMVGSYFTGS